MQHIPRAFGALIVIGFFLPWITVDMGGLAALLGGGEKITLSGMQWATTKNAMRDPEYIMLLGPIAAVAAAFIHSKKGYGVAALLGIVAYLLFGPVLLKEGAAAMGISRGMGFYLSFVGCAGMFISGLIIHMC